MKSSKSFNKLLGVCSASQHELGRGSSAETEIDSTNFVIAIFPNLLKSFNMVSSDFFMEFAGETTITTKGNDI